MSSQTLRPRVPNSLYRPFKAHPWHGVSPGELCPHTVNAYIEMVQSDSVKYEIDKETGHLKVDRPHKYSSLTPCLYGFIPQTYCGKHNGELCSLKSGRESVAGDGDALDICVLTEKEIKHGDILVRAVPIGGFRMIDGNQADDKIIAVLLDDPLYGSWKEIGDCPSKIRERLRHYFLTYKDLPGTTERKAEIVEVYDREAAYEVIAVSQLDYAETFLSGAS